MSVYDDLIVTLSFIPLLLIGMGLVFNTLSFLIFRFTPEFSKMSSMVYLSFVVIIDTLSLFDWNLNHYLKPVFHLDMEFLNMFTCKVFSFGQYYLLQASGFLLSFVSIDRFVAIRTTPGSIYSKLPFGTNKSALGWSIFWLVVLFIFNGHILILIGYYPDPELRNITVASFNQTYNYSYWYQSSSVVCGAYRTGFLFYPTWNSIHLYFYNFIPGAIMIIFNSLLVYTTLWPNRTKLNANRPLSDSEKRAITKKRNLTISLLTVTSAFILLTFPSTIAWGYMSDVILANDYGLFALYMVDHISFLNHVSIFFFTYATNQKFRLAVRYYLARMMCISKERLSGYRANAFTTTAVSRTA